jgi:hypothetical protein
MIRKESNWRRDETQLVGTVNMEGQEEYVGGFTSSHLVRGMMRGYELHATTKRLIGVKNRKAGGGWYRRSQFPKAGSHSAFSHAGFLVFSRLSRGLGCMRKKGKRLDGEGKVS